MESSTLLCKLSSSTDTTFMGCSALLEPNFQVDDLLDFSNEDEDDDDAATALCSPLIPHATAASLPLCATSIQLNKEEAALHEELSHGLCVPPDELVHQLEWLSSFNEDNFFSGGDAKLLSPTPSSSRGSSGPTRCREVPITSPRPRDDFRSESPVSVLEHGGHAYAHHVQRANRIRKARTGGRVWSLDILKPILFENRLKASYENSSLLLTSCSSAYTEPLCSFLQPDDSERPYKKIKQVSANDAMMDSALARKCTHCLVQKTPQWRAGPLGPKTLCNACGVRYKSGRLVPEYRPAASPSFVNEVHSNSHRRILEMRRVKEVESSVKHHKSKVERVYKMDSKSESCIVPHTSEEHICKETHKPKENLFCEDVYGCEEVEESRDGCVSGEDSSSKEDSIEGDIVLCETNITSNEAHLHEDTNSKMASKEKHMQENACVCNMEAVCEGRSLGEKDANGQKSITSLAKLEKWQGHKVEAGVQNDQEKKAVYVAE